MDTDNASFFAGLILAFSLQTAIAGPPILIDRQSGKYLGNLSNNRYDPNSTSNPYGRYGSEYSQDSINYPYGRYGSRYSQDSPYSFPTILPLSVLHSLEDSAYLHCRNYAMSSSKSDWFCWKSVLPKGSILEWWLA